MKESTNFQSFGKKEEEFKNKISAKLTESTRDTIDKIRSDIDTDFPNNNESDKQEIKDNLELSYLIDIVKDKKLFDNFSQQEQINIQSRIREIVEKYDLYKEKTEINLTKEGFNIKKEKIIPPVDIENFPKKPKIPQEILSVLEEKDEVNKKQKTEEDKEKIEELKSELKKDFEVKTNADKPKKNLERPEKENLKFLAEKKEKINLLKSNEIDSIESFSKKENTEKIRIVKDLGYPLDEDIKHSNDSLNRTFEWILSVYEIKAREIANNNTSKEDIVDPINPHLNIFDLEELSEESIKKLSRESRWGYKKMYDYERIEVLKNFGLNKPSDFIGKTFKEKVEILVGVGWLSEQHLKIENKKRGLRKMFDRIIMPINEKNLDEDFIRGLDILSESIEWNLPKEQFLKDKEFEDCKSRFEKGIWGRQVIFERKKQLNEKYEESVGKIFNDDTLTFSFAMNTYATNEDIKYLQNERNEDRSNVISKIIDNFDKSDTNKKIEIIKLLKSDKEDKDTLKVIFGRDFETTLNSTLYIIGNAGLSINKLKAEALSKLRNKIN
ncbi:MAG: hypothetical protein PHT84_01620 [Candidatus Pacebacteria bacterium]|nr:hypothetical protein [Candidatus Paceibacterota bacterium]